MSPHPCGLQASATLLRLLPGIASFSANRGLHQATVNDERPLISGRIFQFRADPVQLHHVPLQPVKE